jgi:hypothetical protein
MTDEEKAELVDRLRNTKQYLDAEAAIRAMDDAADCIGSDVLLRHS